MKLLFIFTGGTIGSTLDGAYISPDRSKAYRLIEAYAEKYGIDFEYDLTEPYTSLSENNTGLQIKALCSSVKASLGQGYDGIIVTHGSDTLQYSAAAVGYCIGLDTEPVCLVASNAPIESETSNALDNLHGAVRFIEGRAGRGAFAVYRNSGSDRVLVHRATRLIGGIAYSDELMSAQGVIYGELDCDFKFRKNDSYADIPDALPPFDPSVLSENNSEALVLYSYPAMTYPKIGQGVKYIIFNTYHSGTLNTHSSSARAFFASARERNIPIYVTGVSEGPQYSSAEAFGGLGITPIPSLSPVAAYIKLWFSYSSGSDPQKILNSPLSSDLLSFSKESRQRKRPPDIV